MQQKKLGNSFVLRIVKDEMAIESITSFCKNHGIQGGFFTGIGAVSMAEIAHYDLETKRYSTKRLDEPLEVTNITGNVSTYQGSLLVHAHATLSNPAMHAFGGHVVELRVSGTLELYFTSTGKLIKDDDPLTGLKLFSLER